MILASEIQILASETHPPALDTWIIVLSLYRTEPGLHYLYPCFWDSDKRQTRQRDDCSQVQHHFISFGAAAHYCVKLYDLHSCFLNQVLTGDRQETAINVGYSCRLMDHATDLIIMNESSLDSTREALRVESEALGGGGGDVTLIIDGQTLKYALACDCRQVC